MKCKWCNKAMEIYDRPTPDNDFMATFQCTGCNAKAYRYQLQGGKVSWEADPIEQEIADTYVEEEESTCDQCEKWFFGTCERWNTLFHSGIACDMLVQVDDELRDKLLKH